jgi:hypothetical protein
MDNIYAGYFDTFILKLNITVSKSNLVFSTYLGGSGFEVIYGMGLDSSDNIYVTGETRSWDFPTTPDAEDNKYNGFYDVFLSTLDSSGSMLLYSTFIGGNKTDHGYGLCIDADNDVYLTGSTNSTDFPLTGRYGTDLNGGYEVFILKFSSKSILKIKSLSLLKNEKQTSEIYTKLCAYTFRIDLLSLLTGTELAEVYLILDPEGTNIKLKWEHSTERFSKVSDQNNYVTIEPSSNAYKYFYNCWVLDFNITFNWNYPDEKFNDAQVRATCADSDITPTWFNTTHTYRVENDLVFNGNLKVYNKYDELIRENDVVRSNSELKWTGLIPVYQGSNNEKH